MIRRGFVAGRSYVATDVLAVYGEAPLPKPPNSPRDLEFREYSFMELKIAQNYTWTPPFFDDGQFCYGTEEAQNFTSPFSTDEWKLLEDSPTWLSYTENYEELRIFLEDYPRVLRYIHELWLDKYKTRFVSASIDQSLNLGNRTSNRVESQHAKLKKYLESARINLDKFVGCIDKIVKSQLTAIRECFGKSEISRYHHHNKPCFDLLRGFISNEALVLMVKEIDRSNEFQLDSSTCGCQLYNSCGFPCACRLSLYMTSGECIPLDSIDIFWRTLDLSPATSLQSDNICCDAELNHVKEHFNNQTDAGKRSVLRKLVDIFNPSKTTIKPPKMNDPDPINPNPILVPPPKESNEVSRYSRSTRSISGTGKSALKQVNVLSKTGSGSMKKSARKGNSKKKQLLKDMDGIEFEVEETEEMDARDEEVEYSTNVHVNGNNVENVASSSNGINVVGEIPVPFEDNPLLNPGNGKVTNQSGGRGETNEKRSNGDAVGEVTGINGDQNGKKPMSFVNAFQGISGYGNNKLARFPVRMNDQASMCEKAYGRASFARVLVEVDATRELVEEIEVCYEKMGKSMNLRVDYAWRPPLCTHCKVFGHEYKNCSNRMVTMEEKTEKAKEINHNVAKVNESNKVNEEWQQARRFTRNEASTSRYNTNQDMNYNVNRGGFNGRGRGRNGMMGRSNVNQRSNYENHSMRYVQVEGGVKTVDEAQVWETKNKGNQGNKGKNVLNSNDGLSNKNKGEKKISIQNSFGVLANEVVEEGSVEWSQMRKKIDLACDLGMQIAESEKTKWSDDLRKYYEGKCAAKAKGKMMEGLKWRILKLQKDIQYGNSNTVMNAKRNADELFYMMSHIAICFSLVFSPEGYGKGSNQWLG
ncbi:hypothetical protein CTI12_AA451060 [Artemisia annua]|uniref:Uncharacterized protein n=1 Tax=Artemisia annua TaxID=35608 RepID=A0A2U1LUJ1_ARTAN|nr:hypothetical protein CTI12_AA451060 [Artemisia annua]